MKWKIAEGQNFEGEAVREEHLNLCEYPGKILTGSDCAASFKGQGSPKTCREMVFPFTGTRDGIDSFGYYQTVKVLHPNGHKPSSLMSEI